MAARRKRKRTRPAARRTGSRKRKGGGDSPRQAGNGVDGVGAGAGKGPVESVGSPRLDPADFALSPRAYERLRRDVDLVKLIPLFDGDQDHPSLLARLMALATIEERTLRRRLTAATGHRPHELLVRLSIRQVARALKASRLPLDELSHRFGYSSSAVLSRVFRRIAGVTVREYRRRYARADEVDGLP